MIHPEQRKCRFPFERLRRATQLSVRALFLPFLMFHVTQFIKVEPIHFVATTMTIIIAIDIVSVIAVTTPITPVLLLSIIVLLLLLQSSSHPG